MNKADGVFSSFPVHKSTEKWSRFLLIMCLLAAAVISFLCVRPARAQQASLSRLVVVGDSLSAGFQNGSLLDSQQVHGYASLLAQQGKTSLQLPLIATPGIPNVLTLVNPGPPPIIVPAPGTSAGRENPFVQTFDLAVPGANLHDVLFTRPSFPIDDFTDLILGFPGLFAAPQPRRAKWSGPSCCSPRQSWFGSATMTPSARWFRPILRCSHLCPNFRATTTR